MASSDKTVFFDYNEGEQKEIHQTLQTVYNALEEKGNAYKIAEDFMNRFIAKKGTVVCRELLGYDVSKPEDMIKIKEMDLFKKTCPEMIKCATEIVDEMLQE